MLGYNKICPICSGLENINQVQLNRVSRAKNSTKEEKIVEQTLNVIKRKLGHCKLLKEYVFLSLLGKQIHVMNTNKFGPVITTSVFIFLQFFNKFYIYM